MHSRWYKWLNERNIFYLVLIIDIFSLCTVKFYPSMDGASHLYNSNIIVHLLRDNSSVFSGYFELNHKIIPNWISYLVLSIFNSFLPAWIAEKILLILYLVGISISFRLLIKQLSPNNIGLSILIFPFSYSFLFHLGFYNYSFSFIFLFLAMYVWLKNNQKKKITTYFLLFILLALCYLSAILSFVFLGLCLGLFAIATSVKDYFNRVSYSLAIRKLIKELTLLLLISLPGLIFSIVFIQSTSFPSSDHQYTARELVKWIFDARCIIVYDYAGEEILTRQFFNIAVAIIAISLFMRFYENDKTSKLNYFYLSDVLIIPMILALVLLFVIPNASNAGMMSDRLCLLFYMLFIIWIAAQNLPKEVTRIFIFLVIFFHLGLLFLHHDKTIKHLNKDASIVYNSSKYIKENSIVLPVNLSDNWLEPHFSNYLGIDKPLVILENYEAELGWFPINWKMNDIPRIKLGELDKVDGLLWPSNLKSGSIKQIDYVLLYGNIDKINEPKWFELKQALSKNFTLGYCSENKYVAIYKIKN